MRSKREQIDNFIEENLLHVSHDEDITQTFETYVEREKRKAVATLCAEENLDESKVATLLDNYLFTDITPREDEVARAFTWTPKILERKTVLKRIYDKVCGVIEKFINGMQGSEAEENLYNLRCYHYSLGSGESRETGNWIRLSLKLTSKYK
ncbi:hypothetical protein LE134_01995 [Escherichia coli]|uniref:type I restriction endonuclease subunit R, EcoR124 family n=1 Tax=Escherichia coli TaxID=562 RepID=UPI003754F201|nr:hypothetical protein [Escherichia coli]